MRKSLKTTVVKYKRYIYLGLSAIILFLAAFFLTRKNSTQDNQAYAKYIDSYTSGTISKKSFIRVHLSAAVANVIDLSKPDDRKLLDFSPSVKGKTYWLDAQTLEFRPDEPLKADQKYDATLNLGLITPTEKNLEKFEFDFKVIKPGLNFKQNGLVSQNNTSLDYMKLTGEINTSDVEAQEEIEKIISVDFDQKLRVKWQHEPAKNHSTFTIDSIKKSNAEVPLTLKWDGKSINAKSYKGDESIAVPAVNVFKVLDIKAMQGLEDYALIQTSMPVNVAQDLNGLIDFGDLQDLRFTIDGSQIKVYAPDNLEGNYNVSVNTTVTNIEEQQLERAKAANIIFENKLPSVAIAGAGTILPNSGKLILPFESINLKAVDVTIIKILESNIPQFFQVNNYREGNELRRVAKPIVQKTIRLDEDKAVDLHKKNRFILDLDKLIRTEPGAMYRVTLGFRQQYHVYECDKTNNETSSSDSEDTGYNEGIDEDDEFWSRYNNYYPNGFTWEDKDDPCTESYYTNERWASRNLLASNIGLIAKRGNDNNMLIIATNLLTTKPISGVTLEFLDYQKQVFKTATTDADGMATFDLKRKPFLLVAKHENERGYLKLDDGNSLPLSRFDVSGEMVQEGIKGFIYGERGVWRPGDSVYLSFVLEDKLKKLPANYPVTFEFYNPKGQLVKKTVIAQSLNGFYNLKTSTQSTALTGNWLAKVKVGGATFSKTVKIETIMPNRLKINFDVGAKTYLGNGGSAASELSAKYLFGTPARNLKAKVDVNLNTTQTKFKGFEQYTFDNPTVVFESQVKTIFEGTLNNEGYAKVNTNLSESNNAPGVLRANFTTKVFEPGGNFSIDNFSLPYHVYNSYLGIKTPTGDNLSGMLVTGKDHVIDIVNVNRDGKILATNKTVKLEVYKVQWRWWWEQDSEENYANFTQNEYNKLINKENITLQNGKGSYSFRINEPEWGRYLILVRDENGGHTTGKSIYVDWPNWAQREQGTNPTEAAMLSFTANKSKFIVGDEITLTIPTGENGRALVSIENGSRVLKTYWINTKKGQTQFKFKAEKNMAPNVFANVTLLQPHAQTVNDLPIRMYGVIPLAIEDPQTILKPIIKMANTLKPEVESTISISEHSGKAMTYSIALVDEGLLDLTRFKTPDPHQVFYAREGLGVKTWDLFDQVLGAWGGNIERILSIGGDGAVNRNLNPAKANRFKPVVKYMGPFYIAKGQTKTHKFTLPQYIGSVRAMVIAGQDGAYGFAEKAVEVKKPLMVLATLPRLIGPGEKFTLPVNIFATNNSLKSVNVQLQTSLLVVSGNKSQQLTFKQAGEQMAYFEITAPNRVGVGKVKIIAKSGSEQTVYDVEMDIRNPNPYVTNVIAATVQPGQTWSSNYSAIGMAGTNSGSLEVSSIPPINLEKRLSYLIQYPHGCVEQITSGLFPQLVLNNLTALTEQKKAQVERNLKTGIARLKNFQTTDGGLSYWPGQANADEWGTNYAGHFLLEAQNLGYTLPVGLIDELIRYQKSKANNWAPNSDNFYGADLAQAYRLYVLALAKKPEMAAMNKLRSFEYLSVAAKWRLAAAYQLAGQGSTAKNLISGLAQSVENYQQLGGTYGSNLRDEAMIMETLTLIGQKTQAAKLLLKVAARLGEDTWYSTQTTAYGLLAIAKFTGQSTPTHKLNYNYTLDGAKGNVSTEAYLNTSAIGFKGNKASVSNNGSNVLFVRLVLAGQPLAGQNNFLPNQPDVLEMDVNYKTLRGQPINPASLKQGTDFYAEVTLKNPGKQGFYENMALTQIFPSGWEIINTRLNDNEGMLQSSSHNYQDIRDDRVFTYFNLRENQTVTYKVLLNASYLGKFYLSSVYCEAMYNNNISASKAGMWVEVVK